MGKWESENERQREIESQHNSEIKTLNGFRTLETSPGSKWANDGPKKCMNHSELRILDADRAHAVTIANCYIGKRTCPQFYLSAHSMPTLPFPFLLPPPHLTSHSSSSTCFSLSTASVRQDLEWITGRRRLRCRRRRRNRYHSRKCHHKRKVQ